MQIKEVKSAGPFVVPGGGAEAHETWFGARFPDDFVNEQSVLRFFKEALRGKEVKWRITFYAETLNDGDKSVACEITMTLRYARQLLSKPQGWSVINCNRDIETGAALDYYIA